MSTVNTNKEYISISSIKQGHVYTGDPIALPDTDACRSYGEVFEDFYIVPVKMSDGTIKNHLVQSGKFYIRESYLDASGVNYKDVRIDPATLSDVTDPLDPIFIGCDLAREIDLTYYNGEYYNNEIRDKNS